MIASVTTCPYCNAQVPADAAAGTKITCPLCGETFTLKGGSTDIKATPGITPGAPASPALKSELPRLTTFPLSTEGQARANRKVAVIILTVMVLMAGVGLTYSLMTVGKRRENDKGITRRSRRPALPPLDRKPPPADVGPVESVAPARLEGLGYLPSQTSVIVGLHGRELLASPVGKELRDRPLDLGGFPLNLDMLRDLVGLRLEDIDHVVLGATIVVAEEPKFPPPLVLVVRTHRPYDAVTLREKFKVDKPSEAKTPAGGKRTVYPGAINLRGFPLVIQLWLADERTFVVGLAGGLKTVPEKPVEGIGHLTADLRQAITQRLAEGMPLWVVGHSENWSKTCIPPLLSPFKDLPLAAQVEKTKTFAVGVIPEKPAKVQAAFRCKDEATAKEIEAKELAPRAKKDEKTFKYTRDGEWLSMQWRVTLGK